MPQAVLPFAYDLLRSFMIARLAADDSRCTAPVHALVTALPSASAASLADMRVLMNEIVRGRLQAFSDESTRLEPDGFLAIPLAFIARTALEHDGSASWSADEWKAEMRRSTLWPLTLQGSSSSSGPARRR